MPKASKRSIPVLSEDSLVKHLKPAPGSLRGFRVEFGFLGRSDREGHWCLYRGPELRDFLEIREADIRHSQSLESESNPLGGTLVWLSRKAVVRSVRVERARSEADFLQGSLMNTVLRGTGVGGLQPGGGQGAVAFLTAFSSAPCALITIAAIIYSAVECGDHDDEPEDGDDDEGDDGEA